MNHRVRRTSAVVALVMAPLMVFVVPVGAAASPVPLAPAASATNSWAYGAVRNVSVSGTTATGWTYVLDASFGYSVILNESNPSSNPFAVSVERSMGVTVSLAACRPDCSTPDHGTGSISFHALETSYAFANFTTSGSVSEGGTSVPALALVNSSSFSNANLTERVALSTLVPLQNWSTYLGASDHSMVLVSFASPLGLIPLNLSAPQSWTSQAAFSAVGLSSWNWYAGWDTLRGGPGSSGPHGGSVTASRSGNVSVTGSYGGSTISFGGTTFPILSLEVVGPFSVREGFILIPAAGDLFSGSTLPWQSNESTVATAQIASVDGRPFVDGHLGVIASSWSFATGAVNPGDAAAPAATAAGDVEPALGVEATSVPTTTVQGAPMSVAAAQQVPECLQSGLGCPSSPTSAPRAFGGLIALGLVAVVIAAIVASVVVVERRRMPPPVYPNANLYPPGQAGSDVRPSSATVPGARPPPAEDDPLSHLW